MCFPSLKMISVPNVWGFLLVCQSTALALLWWFLRAWLWEGRLRSHILVSGVGSRSLHYVRLSETDFDLILSNSNADSKSWKHELLLVSAVAGHDQPALHLARELDKQCLEVNWALTNLGAFFLRAFFFPSIYQISSSLLIEGFRVCPDSPPLQLWSALGTQLSRLCL